MPPDTHGPGVSPDPPVTAAPECFDLDGVRVHGDPNMSDEAKAAVRDLIEATRERMRKGEET